MEKVTERMKWNQRLSSFLITNIELFFYRLGCIVALNPKRTILLTLSVFVLSWTGFLRFRYERNPLKLWIPSKSSFATDSDWLMNTFEKAFRLEATILHAPDVLTPDVFKELAKIEKTVKNIVSPTGHTYEDLCLTIPKISPTDEFIKQIEFSCDLLDFLANTCMEQNILELWDYKEKAIEKITKEDILEKVNRYKRHPVFSNLIIYEDLLGGIVRNKSGHIISATHLHTLWFLKVNYSAVDITQSGNSAGTAEFASEGTLEWESSYLKHMEKLQTNLTNLTMFYSSARSFGDISNETLFQDYDILMIGVVIVTIYIHLVISRCNWIEARLYVNFCSFTTITISFIMGCSLAFAIGTSWGPVHTSLPFLLLGIGIDDILVILSCLDNLTPEQRKLPIHERVGTMLKHAGVSISITTLTDIAAFLIGSTTVLPSLHSYCLFAAFCLMFTFVLTCTFFVALLTFDIRRQADNRNCCFPCKKHPDYKRNKCSQRDYSKIAFEFVYSKVILTWPGKVSWDHFKLFPNASL
ncbi:Hedgehog receptor [Oryctes borbonicus]|uniref:Hedgehog receptor n=1 Tax=Oryctes borbonicus TaxID=1629725 RepID=A0A0T6ATK2_9SCAR|nr:Hedgehog receptor [Oryctes borbonicus]